MFRRKNIIIILFFVIVLAFAVSVARSEFVIRLNRNENLKLIDFSHTEGIQIDEGLLENITSEKYLIIYDSEEEGFIKVKENIEKVLDYIKKDYDTVEVSNVARVNHKYNTIILILEDINKLNNVDDLMQYVFEGGNIFFAYRLGVSENFYSIYRKIGIYEFGEFFDTVGIRLLDNVLIKGRGFAITEKEFMLNSSMSLRVTEDSEKYAESIDGTQLLWKKKYGLGNIIYFNGTMLEVKMNRGLIVGAFSLLEDDFIYPIINTKVSFIDDFPAPVPQGTFEKIEKEFGRTIERFYKDIWWPDMLELASKNNLKYTGVVIGTYNNEVENIRPESTDLNIKDYIYFGRELINNNGEIGIHGYNHQPFSTKELFDKSLGYKPWKDIDTMVDSIEEINKLSKKAFPKYDFKVYVPPSNILYPEGKEAILTSDSDIKIISSLYSIAESKDAYEQEFEICSNGVIEFPRLTSEYMYTDENAWMVLNGITSLGVFSHFVHPDDILDYERTGDKGWSELIKEYNEFNEMVFDNYRWLRAMTASEGANAMIKYLLSEPKYEKKDTYLKIYTNNFLDKIHFILRTEKEIESVESCNIEKVDENTYLIESYNPICRINFKR